MKGCRNWYLFGIWDLDFGTFNTMALPTRIITLNIGSQTIGLAEFRVQTHGGLVLVNYRLREILTEPGGEGMRHAQIAIALREMMHELQIKRGTVNYAIAAQSAFLRFVKLPLVEEEKIDRIIGFEAQQNVPFPINEVVWDYQLVGGGYAEPADSDVARVSKIARNAMTRLHTELMRSITYYRAQQQGSRPERIFLCGGSAGMPYMREFFHEKLKVPIEFFNPLRNVAAVGSAPVPERARSAYLLGDVVGLALRSVSSCPMELNLLPGSVVRKQELERRRPFFIMAAACFILALLGWSAYYARAAQVTRRSTQVLQQKIDIMRTAETRLDRLKKQVASLDSVATPLITAIHDRSFWPEILEELNARLPEGNIWITKLAATSGGKLVGVSEKEKDTVETAPIPPSPAGRPGTKTIGPSGPVIDGINVRGLYMFNPKQQEVVVDYFRNLAGSPFFNINPNKPESVIKSTSVPNDAEWAFPYELQLDLRKPVKLP